MVSLTLVIPLTLAVFSAASATAPGNHGGTVADNDFGPKDLGNTGKVRKHPTYMTLPEADRNYYEHGQPGYNNDGVGGHDTNGNGKKDGAEPNHDRGDLASFCARYNRGAAPDAQVPAPPADLAAFKALMEKIKTCVDDLLSPDHDPQDGWPIRRDIEILNFINAGQLGPGDPMTPAEFSAAGHDHRTGFVCIDHAVLFHSLVRELGFPARQVNVPLSKIQDGVRSYTYQEAAAEVWFDGAWHYFDAYLTGGSAQTSPDGVLGANYTDRKVHVTTTGTRDYAGYESNGDPAPNSGWKKAAGANKNPRFDYEKVASAATFEQTRPGVRMFVTMVSPGLRTGWTPDLPGDPVVPKSLKRLFLHPTLTRARIEIKRSGYLPHGVAQFPVQDPPTGAAPASVTNETVVINDPEEDKYCVTVWDKTRYGADFKVLISAEGGVTIDMPAAIDGRLAPGEIREVACGKITIPASHRR